MSFPSLPILPFFFASSDLHPRHGLFDIESPIRRPLRFDLLLGQQAVDLLDAHQLLDLEDHSGKLRMHGVEDGLHAAAQPKGGKHAPRPLGQANGGTVKSDAKV